MPRKIAPAVKSGDRADALRALRDRLADEIDATESARDLAALSRQLHDVLDAIEALPSGEEASPSAQIEQRRADRRAAASPSVRPESPDK